MFIASTLSAKEEITLIRSRLKRLCPSLSVRNGKGTAWGWVDIRGSADEFGHFTPAEKLALNSVGLSFGGNFAVISPDDREYWLNKLVG